MFDHLLLLIIPLFGLQTFCSLQPDIYYALLKNIPQNHSLSNDKESGDIQIKVVIQNRAELHCATSGWSITEVADKRSVEFLQP